MIFFKVLIAFLIIFNFPVPAVYNSAILAACMATIYYFVKNQYPFNYFHSKYIAYILLSLFAILILSFIPPVIHQTFDFSIISAFILQLGLLLVLTYCMPILLGRDVEAVRFDSAMRLLITVFGIQSIIQILGFVFPPLADLVHFFQKEKVAQMDMGGIRALALTGNPFFALSSAYAFTFLVFVKYLVDSRNISAGHVVTFLLLVIGTFFAGRTGFVGLLLAIGGGILYIARFMLKFSAVLKIGGAVALIILISPYLLPAEIRTTVFDELLPFAFEYIYSYQETGSFTTGSTEALSDMYFAISPGTFFLGDGKYSDPMGGYYMATDAGYMRHILYYGISGQLMLLIYQMFFFYKPLYLGFRNSKGQAEAYNDVIFWLLVILLFFVLHYKGEVIGFMSTLQMMLLLIGTAYVKEKNQTDREVA